MEKNEQVFDQTEIDRIKEALKRTYKERFLFATSLYKTQQTMKKATITHQPFIEKQFVDVFDEEVLRFWKALQTYEVQYILIGGYAINLHGYQRFTGDLDIWIKDSLLNRQALRKAFVSCEMGDYPMVEDMQFVPGWTGFHLNNGYCLDILTEMKGLEAYTFDECFQMASIADIEGISIPFLHLNQLIANKKVVNRPKDQIDVLALEQIRKLRDNS